MNSDVEDWYVLYELWEDDQGYGSVLLLFVVGDVTDQNGEIEYVYEYILRQEEVLGVSNKNV